MMINIDGTEATSQINTRRFVNLLSFIKFLLGDSRSKS